MKVLGLTTEGDSGAALVENGRLVAAVNEERLSRLKLVMGFPRMALREVLRLAGIGIDDLDAILVASTRDILIDDLKPFPGWFQEQPNGTGSRIKKMAGHFARYRNRAPFLEAGYYSLLAPSFWYRRRAIRRILRSEIGARCPIRFVDHHFAHISSAYYTSGFDDALVISIDGGGDGKSGRVYAVRKGTFQPLHEISAFNSLGNYYAYITHLCGFKAMKHEGKITGLAAYGEPRYREILAQLIDERHGTFVNLGGVAFQSAIAELDRRLPPGWTREDLAASVQAHFEDVVRRFVSRWVERTGLENVALAGGVFANVRINEEVHRLPGVRRVFIHPHMADGGLGGGAALAASVPGILPEPMPPCHAPIADVYLGSDLDDDAVAAALQRAGLTPEALDAPLADRVAELLAAGHVVARAAGRMEYGPRALGNRSILYHPTDRKVNDWLNHNLHRTEFMPFAPSIRSEAVERCFEQTDGATHPAEFMTITFHATPWMREHMEGVVHIDGTARPHRVRRDRNEGLHGIIEAFEQRTGLPGIINTSFNMHEEPIVCSADDCVRAFLEGRLDYLAIGRHLVKHPRELSHQLIPARPA